MVGAVRRQFRHVGAGQRGEVDLSRRVSQPHRHSLVPTDQSGLESLTALLITH